MEEWVRRRMEEGGESKENSVAMQEMGNMRLKKGRKDKVYERAEGEGTQGKDIHRRWGESGVGLQGGGMGSGKAAYVKGEEEGEESTGRGEGEERGKLEWERVRDGCRMMRCREREFKKCRWKGKGRGWVQKAERKGREEERRVKRKEVKRRARCRKVEWNIKVWS